MDKFREECGVFGIFGHRRPRNLTYLGLYAPPASGQESAGIASSDGGRIRLHKAMGYVNEAFNSETLAKLPGTMAIGHVRYSTAGESLLANAHTDSGRQRPRAAGGLCTTETSSTPENCAMRSCAPAPSFQTNSDTEVIVHLFARSREVGVEAAVIEAISQVRGAFSFVMMTRDR
jgi:amidophosphoribosyltransferase